jgi:hypothetical protein
MTAVGISALTLSRLSVFLRPESVLFLPGYKGSAFRGGFGHVFKSIVCPTHDLDCIHQRLGQCCVYSEVFETPVPPGSEVMRKYPYAPHPFVLTPPLDKRAALTAEDEPCLELVLVGKAVPWLAYFICTIEELGRWGIGRRRSRYRVDRVTSQPQPNGGAGDGTVVYDGVQRKVVGTPHIIQGSDLAADPQQPPALTIRFLTPARIISEGELASQLPFVTLFRTLLRRVALLAYFHCGQPADVEAM